MSLLQRVERAQQRPTTRTPRRPVVAPPPPPPPSADRAGPRRAAARDPAPPPGRGHARIRLAARRHRPSRAADQGRGRSSTASSARKASPSPATSAHAWSTSSSARSAASGRSSRCSLDETITEIMVNGPNHLYIERGGKIHARRQRTSSTTSTSCGSSTGSSPRSAGGSTQSSPRVDARLPDGSRVNAVIEPLSLVGPVITVRKFPAKPITVDDLIRSGRRPPEMFDFLRACVEARLNVFVSGGTGSGKTTTLNVLSSFIPEDERIVTIEDAAELQLRQAHVVDARGAAAEPRGRRRDHDPRPAAQCPAHAARPDHRRGVSLGRGARHAPGDDDRPGRVALDRPREHPGRHAPPARDDGPDDRLRAAAAGDPRADRLGGRPDRPHRPAQGRLAQDRQHHRGLRDRRRRDPDPGHLRLRADRRSATGKVEGQLKPTGIRPTFMAQVQGERDRRCRQANTASRPRTRPTRPSPARTRDAGGPATRSCRSRHRAPRSGSAGRSRPAAWSTSRRSGRSIPRPARSSSSEIKEQTRQCLTEPQGQARGGRQLARQGRLGELVAARPDRVRPRSTRNGCAGSRATRRSARGR